MQKRTNVQKAQQSHIDIASSNRSNRSKVAFPPVQQAVVQDCRQAKNYVNF